MGGSRRKERRARSDAQGARREAVQVRCRVRGAAPASSGSCGDVCRARRGATTMRGACARRDMRRGVRARRGRASEARREARLSARRRVLATMGGAVSVFVMVA